MDWPGIELTHGLDQLASEIIVREGVAQPVGLLDGAVPRISITEGGLFGLVNDNPVALTRATGF